MSVAASSDIKTCPECGKQVPELLRVDAALRSRLVDALGSTNIPLELCPNCYSDIGKKISKGAVIRAQQQAREQNKLILWKGRVNYVKQGRKFFAQKSYTDAAVCYQKYLRIIEVAYDKKPGDLNPQLLKDKAQTSEITIIASVLWDLFRIYDASPRFHQKQNAIGKMLLDFAKLSPIQNEIAKAAKMFEAQAKNPTALKDLLKKMDRPDGRCFIATAAFESPLAFEVLILSRFRDETLSTSFVGRLFISVYYKISPPIAELIVRLPWTRAPVKKALSFIALNLARK